MRAILALHLLSIGSIVNAIGPLGSFGVGVGNPKCEQSLTTASGPYVIHKNTGNLCTQ